MGLLNGIEVTGAVADGDITVATGDITVDADAVQVNQTRQGTTEVDTTGGTLTSLDGDGVEFDGVQAGDVSITTGDVTAEFEPVDINLEASGDASVDTSQGTITSLDQEGIFAVMTDSGGLTVTTGDVTGNDEAIQINATGSGDVEVDTSARTLSSETSDAMRVTQTNGGTTTITTGPIDGNDDGLEVDIDGSGTVDIDTTGGAVVGEGFEGVEFDLGNSNDANLTTADVTGGTVGVDIDIYASGNLGVDTSAGAVTGNTNSGFYLSAYDSEAVDITTADVTGTTYGVDLSLEQTGEVSVDTTLGNVTGTNNVGLNIVAEDTGYMDIDTADVTGAGDGIAVELTDGDGIDIDSDDGMVTGQGNRGISVDADNSGDVAIFARDVTGAESGIEVQQNDGDDVDILTVNGTVTGQSDAGIDVIAANGGTVAITTGDVAGQTYGILATSDDNASLNIDTTGGVVTGTQNVGVSGYARSNIALDVVTGDVTGGEIGVYAGTESVDQVRVDTTGGELAGQTDIGIELYAYAALSVEVDTADVTGIAAGVSVRNGAETGSIRNADIAVDTTAGTVTGETLGVEVINEGDGSTEVAVADVAAQGTGVQLSGESNAAVEIVGTVTGDVGLDTTALEDEEDLGTTVEITGQVIGTGGTALALGGGVHNVVIFDALAPEAAVAAVDAEANAGAGIDGDTVFGLSDDTLTFGDGEGTSGVFSGTFSGLFDGGEGTDTAFFDLTLDALVEARFLGPVLELDFTDALQSIARLRFQDFEFFSFGDPNVLFAAADVPDQARGGGGAGGGGGGAGGVAPVPLPGGVILPGAALGALGWSHRRRARG